MITTSLEIHELIDLWIASLDIRKSSQQAYDKLIRYFFKWILEKNINEREVRREHILEYKSYLLDHLSETSARLYLITVKMFYGWLNESDHISANICQDIKLPKFDNRFRKYALTRDQVNSMLATCDRSTLMGLRDYAMIRLMVTAGLRRIEVIRLNVGDITAQDHGFVIWIKSKGHFDRIPVGIGKNTYTSIMQYLDEYSDIHEDEPLFRGCGGKNKYHRLSPNHLSALIKSKMYKIKMINSSNKKFYSCHSLRHTAATLLMEDESDIYTTQKMLRHKSTATTELYIKMIGETKALNNKHISSLDRYFKLE